MFLSLCCLSVIAITIMHLLHPQMHPRSQSICIFIKFNERKKKQNPKCKVFVIRRRKKWWKTIFRRLICHKNKTIGHNSGVFKSKHKKRVLTKYFCSKNAIKRNEWKKELIRRSWEKKIGKNIINNKLDMHFYQESMRILLFSFSFFE